MLIIIKKEAKIGMSVVQYVLNSFAMNRRNKL